MDQIPLQKHLWRPLTHHLQNSKQVNNQVKIKPDSPLHHPWQQLPLFHLLLNNHEQLRGHLIQSIKHRIHKHLH